MNTEDLIAAVLRCLDVSSDSPTLLSVAQTGPIVPSVVVLCYAHSHNCTGVSPC
jgi:hypothetical protein